ncbi:putative MOZ SAS family [Trypanosoma vivax]|uniref:histone acetyltransferase n=2 Tax=Trypanosoma vivax (strain Y486) TaxID=1055687 RepID=G0U7B2_TRYVY|nr:putative acetyltransferase [Trypanosoma vivax]KAH8620694.1 putative MOZ SAS family [Trypanosoma vivax]CCC51770.1 putative acetyltransferase [Trypanosoma vivax Y486]
MVMIKERAENIAIRTLFREYHADYASGFFHSNYENTNEIFLCEACLSYFPLELDLQQHMETCPHRYWIPGDEIYRCAKRKCVVFEIDGRRPECAAYTRRIARLAKLFLEEKTTLDDLHFFAFIALFEVDDYGYHFTGYFSKEWRKSVLCTNTLSCVVVLPPYRAKGYGSLLIEISYEMGRIERVPGTPERPLSATGRRVFQKMWQEEVLRAISSLHEKNLPVTINSLSSENGMTTEDVAVALHRLGIVFNVQQNGPLICVPRGLLRSAKKAKRIDPKSFKWVPLF